MTRALAKFHNAEFATTKTYTLSGELELLKMQENATMDKIFIDTQEQIPESLKDPEKDKM